MLNDIFAQSAFSVDDLINTGPVTILSIVALVVLIVEALRQRTETANFWIAVLGFLAAGCAAFSGLWSRGSAYAGMVTTGGYADFFSLIFSVVGLLCVLLSGSYVRKRGIEHSEFYSLVLLSVVGMMMMASAADLVVVFLGLELMSLSFYILAGWARTSVTSNEAGLKYFLLGAFATGFLLYGIALLYGATGTTRINATIGAVGTFSGDPTFVIGLGLLLVGLVFKVAAVPFHMWVPDVYEGAPTTVTALMSTGGKAAAFSAFLLVFSPQLVAQQVEVREILAAVSALTMVVGNILALAQNNVKRMLAYSSIAHAGYILTGLVAANEYGSNGVLFYALSYAMMNMGAFGVVSLLESGDGGRVTFDDYVGLSSGKPVLAGLMGLFMFGLAGIPPFAGFFGKYYVFAGAIGAGYTWLTIIGVLMSAVSAYYYLRLVVLMYFREQPAQLEYEEAGLSMVAILISAAAVLLLGIFPGSVIGITSQFF